MNGIVLDYQGKLVRNEAVDFDGKLISINGVSVEDIPGYTGKVIHDEHGRLISMFGPLAREFNRDGNGKLLFVNGKRAPKRYDEIHWSF